LQLENCFTLYEQQITTVMKTKCLLLIAITALLLGCSSPYKKLNTTYNPENNEGLIVGTICIEKKLYNIFTFMYSDDLPGSTNYPNQKDSFTYKNSVGDVVQNGNIYYFFSIAKPAGKFKFYKIKIYNNMRNDPSTIEIPIDMKFNIEKGKTTYFGELHINTQKKSYTVENQIERDRQWFAQKLPQIQF
jgi:hypothetical protein